MKMGRFRLSPSEIMLAREITGHRPAYVGHREVNVQHAIALYNMFNDWNLVAQAMPGGFNPRSIERAVRLYDRGLR